MPGRSLAPARGPNPSDDRSDAETDLPDIFVAGGFAGAAFAHGAARRLAAFDEAGMKQFLTPMKPFSRFRANVLKRLAAIEPLNDAPKPARRRKTGVDNVQFNQAE
jgi:hypothetical protein